MGSRHLLLSILFWTCSYSMFLAVTAFFWPGGGSMAAVAADAVFLCSSIVVLFSMQALPENEIVLAILCATGFALAFYSVHLLGRHAARALLQAPLLLMAAYGLARLLVNRIEASWHIAAAALVALFADMWSVFSSFGVTNTIVSKHPYMLDYLLLSFPVPGCGIRPILGVVDYAFLAIFYLHAKKYDINPCRSAWAIVASLVLTLTFVNMSGTGLPAVPLMAVFFLAVNIRRLWRDFADDVLIFKKAESDG